MEPNGELKTARDEVLRKIGRNMLLFQQVEQSLKFLIANGNVSGYVSEFKANLEKRVAIAQKQMMGQLVGQYLEDIHVGSEGNPIEGGERKEAFFSFGFKVETDADDYELKKQALASIVAERNELIHHLLPRFNPNSIESCLETQLNLDQQREKILPELDELQEIIKTLQEGRRELVNFLISDEGRKELELSCLQQSPVVRLLIDIACQSVRTDGWVVLNTARQLIQQQAQEEWIALRKRYGYKTLKALMMATELFEIYGEPTVKGGIRVLFRLKPDWALLDT